MKKIICILILAALLGGCSLGGGLLLKKGRINSAYKNDDKNQAKIERNMGRQQVLDLWGRPMLILVNKDAKDKSWEEMWVYKKTLSDTGGMHGLGRHIKWELFFAKGKLEIILMNDYDTVSRTSEEVLANWRSLVNRRLKETNLIPND